MPNYDYKCVKCAHVEQKTHAMYLVATQDVCKKCGGKLEKLISPGSPAVYKTDGFYTKRSKG